MADLLTPLLPVIVGGLLALTGAFLGPRWLEKQKEAAERRNKRAQKFEELVTALYEHHHWITVMRGVRVHGEDVELTMSPIAKVQAISAVYFPEFHGRIYELDIAADKFEVWAIEAGKKRLSDDPNYADGAKEAYNPYFEELLDFVSELRAYARREFQ